MNIKTMLAFSYSATNVNFYQIKVYDSYEPIATPIAEYEVGVDEIPNEVFLFAKSKGYLIPILEQGKRSDSPTTFNYTFCLYDDYEHFEPMADEALRNISDIKIFKKPLDRKS